MTVAVEVGRGPMRPRDRANYLAALAVGLATAGVPDDAAVDELVAAADGRHGDAVAARRRLYASTLGSCERRRQAARLLALVCQRTARPGPVGRVH